MSNPFDHCAEKYAACRPRYPKEVFEVIRDEWPADESPILDCGAGTGIFTEELGKTLGRRCVAADISASMLRSMEQHRGVCRVVAKGETLPLHDGSVGLVTAAQAFHWFNPPVVLREFARVLQSRGGLVLCWNNRHVEASAFVGAFEVLVKRYNTAYECEYRRQDWPAKIEVSGLFEQTRYWRFEDEWRLTQEEFIGFTHSVSYIRNVLSKEQRHAFETELRQLIKQHSVDGVCVVPMWTDLWLTTKLN